MPVKFRPSRGAGLARGLSVVEGEADAAARARALRARGQPAVNDAALRTVPELSVVDAATGGARPVVRAPRFSSQATAEQAMRSEAMTRHAGAVEDPRSWFAPETQPRRNRNAATLDQLMSDAGAAADPLQVLHEQADSFGWSKRAADAWYRRMVAEYEAARSKMSSKEPEPGSQPLDWPWEPPEGK